MDGNIKTMTLNEFLGSNEFGPLTKFFVLYQMQSEQEALDTERKERIWKGLKERLEVE